MLKFFKITVNKEDADAAGAFLNREEKAAAGMISDEFLRLRFILVRGTLRKELSAFLNIAPEKIELGETENGKRFVVFPKDKIFFNISHSRDCSLIAIADYEIGIDVEKIRPLRYKEIMKYCFSEAEQQEAAGNPENFFRIWTAKEALVKLKGGSLFKPDSPAKCGADSRVRIRHKKAGNYMLAVASYRHD